MPASMIPVESASVGLAPYFVPAFHANVIFSDASG
jgi:hypothetical protein